MTATITITLNGKPYHCSEGTTIHDMIAKVGADVAHIAVEQNHIIIARSQFAKTVLHQGDTVELVEFVGGG
jgi:thiamine biosynthesis protein ThiS